MNGIFSHFGIVILFLIIAFIYASVGFGGGSSYLAVLAMYELPFKEMRIIALCCNIVVVTGGTIIYIQKGQANLKKIIPLVLVSVPLAFLGAAFKISQQFFFILLGASLIAAAVLLWINSNRKIQNLHKNAASPSFIKDGLIGGAIGFLSGMVGIGGGIFLSPALNLMGWDTPKKIAAAASIFILLNSFAGIAGYVYQLPEKINWSEVVILFTAVLIGGQLGSRLGAVKLNELLIKKVTAILVLIAGIEVLYKHLV
jgi:uncharacterized membrane protein YfcA